MPPGHHVPCASGHAAAATSCHEIIPLAFHRRMRDAVSFERHITESVKMMCSDRCLVRRTVCTWSLIFVATMLSAGCLGHSQSYMPSQLIVQEAVVRHWLTVLTTSEVHCLTLGQRRPLDPPMHPIGDPPAALIARFAAGERTVRPGSECHFELGNRRLHEYIGPRHLPTGSEAVILVFSEVSPSGRNLYEVAVDVIGSGMGQAGYICELRRTANAVIVEGCRGTWIS